MGMYTELIFGAELKKETPKNVIEDLKIMVDGDLDKTSKEVAEFNRVFRISSYYFGISEPVNKIWFDDISDTWKLSTRSNIKNYGSEIESFLEWIKPWIESGSGSRDFYAIVTYEEQEEPTIYYLDKYSSGLPPSI